MKRFKTDAWRGFLAFAFCIVLMVQVTLCAGCRGRGNLKASDEDRGKTPLDSKILIKHGWDMPSIDWVAKHPHKLSQAPFAGVMLDSPLRDLVFSDQGFDEETVREAILPYCRANLPQPRYDFLLLYASHQTTGLRPPDVFDDWSGVIDNMRHVAKISKMMGLHGIAFDNEPYGPNWFAWDEPMANRANMKKYREQYRRRGVEVMTAIEQEWPEAVLMLFLGPQHSLNSSDGEPSEYPFLGEFYAGMVSGLDRVTLVDAGELFWLRSQQDYLQAARKIRYDYPAACPFIGQALRERWPDAVRVGFGVYDRYWYGEQKGQQLDLGMLESKLIHALHASDRYVWYYTESYDWWRDNPKSGMSSPEPELLEKMISIHERTVHRRD